MSILRVFYGENDKIIKIISKNHKYLITNNQRIEVWKMAKRHASFKTDFKKWGRVPSCFGLFLLVLGLLWLAQDFGYLEGVPIWPLSIILLGLCLTAKKCC